MTKLRLQSLILALICLVFGGTMVRVHAQATEPPVKFEKPSSVVSDTLSGWNYSWMAGLSGSQASFRNWSQGGTNTISGTAMSWFEARYRKGRFGYLLSTNLKYGQSRIEGQGTRKTSDQISIKNKFSYNFDNPKYSIYGNFDFSSQFDKGIDYETPEDKVISRFMAPGYFRQGIGLSYEPYNFLTLEAGVGFKETYMRDTDLSQRYGLEPGDKFRFEAGGAFNISFEKRIMKNIMFQSSFESFSNIQKSLKHTDITFSNQLVGSINDYINTSFNFVLVYDRDYSAEVQIKQMLSAGIQIDVL